ARAPAVQYRDSTSKSLIGSVLAERYQILAQLGVGGMATVYRGEHMAIRKKCAIKVLHPEEAHKDDIVERFLQEARAASVIDNENVVEISDFGRTEDNCVFLVMEMLDGEDLAETLAEVHRLPWARAKPILLQICDALAAAHDKGIIHRDMKPENCFRLERRGNPDFIKVLDFGIAKITSESIVGPRALTQTGMVFGTPEYMSPEQAEGHTVDRRTDIYSLGIIMFQLLTGRVPFRGDSPTTTLVKHLVDTPPPPSLVAPDAGISPDLDAIVLKALQKDPDRRFQDMREFAATLRAVDDLGSTIDTASFAFADDQSPDDSFDALPTGGKHLRTATVIAAITALGVTAFFLLPTTPKPKPEPEPSPAPAVIIAAEPEPEPEPTPETVSIQISTNTPATIINAETKEELGTTADEQAIRVVKSDETLRLKLIPVADAYDEKTVEIVPNTDVNTKTKLKRRRRRKRKKNTRGKANYNGPVNPF
ncbi:MAG TPA: serine/threonine protein kinase, partial [Nannocystis exedens]|nr:serine/threonine protein kinase [Nannocystis exedens]